MPHKNRMATDIYLNYWKTHIYPLKEENRKVAFASILLEVIQSLYGIEAMWELGGRMVLYSVEQRTGGLG